MKKLYAEMEINVSIVLNVVLDSSKKYVGSLEKFLQLDLWEGSTCTVTILSFPWRTTRNH